MPGRTLERGNNEARAEGRGTGRGLGGCGHRGQFTGGRREPAPTETITVEPMNPTSGLPGSEWMFGRGMCERGRTRGHGRARLPRWAGSARRPPPSTPMAAGRSESFPATASCPRTPQSVPGRSPPPASTADTGQVLVDYETATFEVNPWCPCRPRPRRPRRPGSPTTTTTAPETQKHVPVNRVSRAESGLAPRSDRSARIRPPPPGGGRSP